MRENINTSDNDGKLENLKQKVVKDLGVEDKLNQNIYMGNIPSNMINKLKSSGNVGGEMVKRMIEIAETNMVENFKK